VDKGPKRGSVGRRGLHAYVVDEVGRRIVTRVIEADSVLDLGALEKEFGASHTAMREAIKVLTAKQLVDARPKLGTYVLPRVYWNLLDADVMSWRDADVRLQEELAEARAVMEPAAADLAARRARASDMARIWDSLDKMVNANLVVPSSGDSWHAVTDADVEFHAAIAAASGNELFEHFQRLLMPAMRARDLATLPSHHEADFIEDHRRVAEAIAAGDPDGASAAMASLVARAKEDFHAGIGGSARMADEVVSPEPEPRTV
jgi:DNA-binding FadR family transcriptional regulator